MIIEVVVMRFSTHSKRTFESIHKPDDDQSCDKILPSFEPDMFESIHKPDDEQSSDEILHPFKPGSLLCWYGYMISRPSFTLWKMHRRMNLIVTMRKLFMSLKVASSRVVATLIVYLQVVVKIICWHYLKMKMEMMVLVLKNTNSPTESRFYFNFSGSAFFCSYSAWIWHHRWCSSKCDPCFYFIDPWHFNSPDFPKNLPGVLRIASIDTLVECTVYVVPMTVAMLSTVCLNSLPMPKQLQWPAVHKVLENLWLQALL